MLYTSDDLQNLTLDATRPLVISDADEVILHFAAPFREHLKTRDMYVDFQSYALWGNVRHQHNNQPLEWEEIGPLINEFLDHITPIQPVVDGAVHNLLKLADIAQVLILTNVSSDQAQKRHANLRQQGLEFPLISNSGPKGPVVDFLQRQVQSPVIFIDDIDRHISSVAEFVPQSYRLHFIADSELAAMEKQAEDSHLRCHDWDHIRQAVEKQIGKTHLPTGAKSS